MTTKDEENQALGETLERREAGVAELFKFYTKVETIYAAAAQALEEGRTAVASNSTNRK